MTENCNIRDLPHTGNFFSWVGYRDDQWIHSRLDRALGNESWFSLFPPSCVKYLDLWASDHRPLLVTFTQLNTSRGLGRFTYDSRMSNKPGIDDVVARGWHGEAESSSTSVIDRLARCRRELARWKRSTNQNSLTKIAALHASLEHEITKPQPSRDTLSSLKSELSKAYMEEEQFWKAKSRVSWLKEGDKNTRYFHNCVKGRKLKNKILMLHDSAGLPCFDEDSKGQIAVQYFQDLFSSSTPSQLDPKVEALIATLAKAETQGLLHGVRFSNSGPSVNNLMFADDSLLICKANIGECQELARCLDLYSAASGQLINFQKSSIIFGSKVDQTAKQAIQNLLNIPHEGGEGTYLGLPECFSGSKRRLLRFIHEKLKRRLNGWFSKSLSQGGKEILMKSIALALPVYAMSCFRLSQDLYEKITSAMIQYWWSSGDNHRKIPWVAWKALCREKEKGGLGFHDLADFNQALLCKQAWRVLDNPDSLFAKVLKSRYFNQDHFLAARLGPRPSYAWRSILFGRELLSRGLLRSIGNGRETYALTANWIWDSSAPRPPIPLLDSLDPHTRVVDFIDRASFTWRADKVKASFVPQDAAFILNLRISADVSDSFIWGHTPHGSYSSKNGYKVLQNLKSDDPANIQANPLENALWTKIWKLKTAPKIRHFIWRALSGALAVADRLQTRNVQIPSLCKGCLSGVESIAHVLFTCPRADTVWRLSGIPLPPAGFSPTSVFLNIHYLVALLTKDTSLETAHYFPWVLWQVWKQRNDLVFEKISWEASQVWLRAKQEVEDYMNAQTGSAPTSHANGFQRWHPPMPGFLKCNVAGSWVGPSKAIGVAWLLRDDRGLPLLHGRNSFSPGKSHLETDLLSLLWAAESISTLNYSQVVFVLTSKQAQKAVMFPSRFPSLRVLTGEILVHLNKISGWQLLLSSPSSNEVARRLAASVTSDVRPHSFIQTAGPSWLQPQLLLDSAFL